MRITAVSGCTLLDTNGIPQTTIDTDAFARGKSLNVWTHVCDINNFSHTPTITFSWVSGGFNRWYMDEVRFQGLDCCCCGFVPAPGITGPLAAGQTNVSVTAVLAGAINVTVYANLTIPIGGTNYAPGFVGGTITVPTVPLVRGDTITATQTRTNAAGEPCTSGQPASGPIVGSGGPKLILSLGCQKNTSLTGPIGAPTPSPGTDTLYWVKATGTAFGLSGTAPVGGWEVIPSQCWQTFAFNWQTDPCLAWLGNTAYTETNAFAVLESLAIGMDANDPDSGPYAVYVDKIMNGNVVLADFECDAAGEGYPNGMANVNFANPNATAIPPPGYFLSNPLSTRISGREAFSGTNSCRFEWQFVDNARIRSCRLLMDKAPLVYPQLDTTKPVTLSVLVLPADVNVGHKFNGTVSAITNSTPICTGGSVTMGVTVTGSGSYTYQWSNAVGQIPGATAQTYTTSLPGKPPYSIIVSDGTCSVTPAPINLDASVRPVTITGMSGSTLTYAGGNGCQFVLLQSADGTAPLANWTTNAIGTVLPGSFTIPTVGAGTPMYYIIRSE